MCHKSFSLLCVVWFWAAPAAVVLHVFQTQTQTHTGSVSISEGVDLMGPLLESQREERITIYSNAGHTNDGPLIDPGGNQFYRQGLCVGRRLVSSAKEHWIREHPVGANKNNNSLFSDIYFIATECFVVRGNLSVLKGGQRTREILAACDHISSYLRDASTAQGPVVVS